jgi:hypothetical protein
MTKMGFSPVYGPPFTVNSTFLKQDSLLKKCLSFKKRSKKAKIVAFYRVKKSKIAFFCRFWEEKKLTFPDLSQLLWKCRKK